MEKYINNIFNESNQQKQILADAFFDDVKKMTNKFLAFVEEPATYHFLLALAIYLVGGYNPSLKPLADCVAAFFGVTGVITYTK